MWPFKRNRKTDRKVALSSHQFDTTPTPPIPFGYKTEWWVVSSEDLHAVASFIGLVDPRPCGWKSGLNVANHGGVFVAPPINGWTIIKGKVHQTSDPRNDCVRPLELLSKRFGDAQYYCSHRTVSYYVWAIARNGELERGYETTEAYLWDEGDSDLDEGFDFDFPDEDDFENRDEDSYRPSVDWPNEDMVGHVAARWSISPLDFNDFGPVGVGLASYQIDPKSGWTIE